MFAIFFEKMDFVFLNLAPTNRESRIDIDNFVDYVKVYNDVGVKSPIVL